MSFSVYPSSHAVCVKYEHYVDSILGRGIKFQTSSYEELDRLIESKQQLGINKYLDSTFGYYTLDRCHNFVLAHYNWHRFASTLKSKGICSPELNIQTINKTFNKRIKRMLDLCDSADHIFFITSEDQGYEYMMIDDVVHDLHDFSELNDTLSAMYKSRVQLVQFSEVNQAEKLLSMIS